MPNYIDVDILRCVVLACYQVIEDTSGKSVRTFTVDEILQMIDAVNPANVQPIKFGKWKMAFGTHRLNRSICSCCGWSTDEYGAKSYKFCPFCGALMREEE